MALFVYVTTHLLNHALCNYALDWAERGLLVQKFIWQGVLGTAVLYGAFTVHFLLGLYALYERRSVHWTAPEVLQLVLGLAVPPLLANHLIVTRVDLATFGVDKGYAQEFYSFWFASPNFGRVQLALLVVAWLHGCMGIRFWLRLQPWFGRIRGTLLCGMVMLPVLALLGYLQGGRAVTALLADPATRAEILAPQRNGVDGENLWLADLRNDFLVFDGGAVGLILLARLARSLAERRKRQVTITYPGSSPGGGGPRAPVCCSVPVGFSVLETSRRAGIPHASICGGRGRCTMCRVRLVGAHDLPGPTQAEQRFLARIGADAATVRLACQIRPKTDIAVIPLVEPEPVGALLRRRRVAVQSEERFLVFVFVDMRNSTRLAAARPPFDAMFILGRFVNAVSAAVVEAGGAPAEFRGDAVVAAFGQRTDARTACRQAYASLALIARNLAALSLLLRADLDGPLGFGIGVDGSQTVSGEIGVGDSITVTAFGDALSVAARLQDLTKELGCDALVSEEVMRRGGLDTTALPPYTATLRGFEHPVPVRIIRGLGEQGPGEERLGEQGLGEQGLGEQGLGDERPGAPA